MLYHIFEYLGKIGFDVPGGGMVEFLTFRAALAVILALIITITLGKFIIRTLQRHQIGEEVRDLGLEGQLAKKGTPTMGGVMILLAIMVPTLLCAQLTNTYVILLMVATVWLGLIGFLDDYIKVFRKNKDGLNGKLKIVGQVGLGCLVAFALWNSGAAQGIETTIPFIKDNEFNYGLLTGYNDLLTMVLYVLISTFVVTAVSNGANLTDGLDGLASGVSVPVVSALGVLAYLSGHVVYSDYLNIMYIEGSGEMVIFAAAMVGALIGFLWYNSFPAQIFMGDTGSLAIGGIIAVFALCIRKELLLPLMCGVFLVESLSVMMQVGYFKYTKRRYGEGRRIFLMSPIHHHFQRKGLFETKIVIRFCIVSILLAVMTLATLKIR